ncbi:MAG: hypothetical protein C0505_17270 [Leptothrix sp. (in: Bacteria)]|nr:hypothetical protein [Leptothrix sp. (in: b-proteobacteria)]
MRSMGPFGLIGESAMRSKLFTVAAALAGMSWPAAGNAGTPAGGTVPEPGTWALVGLAAALGWAVTRGKRK